MKSDQSAAWLPLADAYSVNADALEAAITMCTDDAYLQFVEAGMPTHQIQRAIAFVERFAREQAAKAIASGQARLRAELQEGDKFRP